jgi:glycosyltransferase involved in cell wall biosynthesis
MSVQDVTLVIPARNASGTIEACLRSVVPLRERAAIKEIILVDDGSTDDTAQLAKRFEVRYIKGLGKGPASARNLGWRAATSTFIWFIDSDCVPEPDALSILLEHMDDSTMAAVGGSYANLCPESLLASLIHEEIVERHQAMPSEVSFMATFNALFRREWLETVEGFNELFVTAEDSDLAFRIRARGGRLKFDIRSRVGHFHPKKFWRYLQTQRRHGYWRAWLYIEHPERMTGDSYSGLMDHMQPPLAILSLASLFIWPLNASAPFFAIALVVAQMPMSWRIVQRTGERRYAAFGAMSFIRAYARAFGMVHGAIEAMLKRWRNKDKTEENTFERDNEA